MGPESASEYPGDGGTEPPNLNALPAMHRLGPSNISEVTAAQAPNEPPFRMRPAVFGPSPLETKQLRTRCKSSMPT